ncbi:CpsD/CapB family tyrosine-protein kinase [Marinicrinis sediminis]|uniref:CpsD/CapB family tyrosine-protein kinase n=1 Tax=Marinicrinis sediminis TaxID=1652465 RepID=A0ABW5RCC3_9BACL
MSRQNHKYKMITDINPRSPVSEAYKMLRTHIQYSMKQQHAKSILVTSSIAGEGKTLTAVNLAGVYALEEKKVIVLDADLRKPTMHHYFYPSRSSSQNGIGLSEVLMDQFDLAEGISQTHIPNLHFLQAGQIPHHPSELLSSSKMDQVLSRLYQMYDVIIIDSPPLLAVADAQIAATKVDGVVLVVQAGKVKKSQLSKAKSTLELVKANLLGAVLNQKNKKEAESYYDRHQPQSVFSK